MQVTETLAEGLKRELKIVVPVTDLQSRLAARLDQLKDQVQIKGFRPGKVPIAHLKRIYGRSAMAEIVQEVLGESTRQALNDRSERAAMQPNLALPEDETEAEKVLAGEADLAFSMTYEILPKVELGDFKGMAIERPVVAVADEDVERDVVRMAESLRPFAPKDGAAENGDRVTMAYVGSIDGEPFEGGSDDNATLDIGSGRFIPGFEEQLIGATAGERRSVTVAFPDDYAAANLAGKTAVFDVTVKEVAAPGELVLDDEGAKRLGAESAAKLRDAVRQQIEMTNGYHIRQRVKRQVLDRLDEMHKFDLPPSMVDQEFNNIWEQVVQDMQQSGRSFEDEKTTEEAARADYRAIAERRVRLGLVLSEIGDRIKIEVSQEELQRALAAQLRQFPGREQQIYEFYQRTPEALASLRAPIFEEKVVDYLLELAQVADKPMTKEELLAAEEEPAQPAAA